MSMSLADLGEISKAAEDDKRRRGQYIAGAGLASTAPGIGLAISGTRASNKALNMDPVFMEARDLGKTPGYYEVGRRYKAQHGVRMPGVRRSIASNAVLAGSGLATVGGALMAGRAKKKRKSE